MTNGWNNNPWGRAKGQVLLQMMGIPALRKKGEHEVVLWDTAMDTNYVRLEHAKKHHFPWRMETAIVSTVGGEIQTRMLPVFECQIKDLSGIPR